MTTKKTQKTMTKTQMIQKLLELGINVAEPEKYGTAQLAQMIEENTPKTQKEETTMKEETKKTSKTNKKAEETKKTAAPAAAEKKPQKEDKKAERATRKEDVGKEVDAWLENFQCEATANGKKVVIKTWEKIPTCRSLKVDGVTYFEMYFSANGVRLNAKSELIPKEIRPEGSNIVKNGLDLCIPTFSNISEGLTKYADACRKSLADKAAKKAEVEAAKKAKAEMDKAAAKAAKEAEKKAKAAAKEAEKKAAEAKEPETK